MERNDFSTLAAFLAVAEERSFNISPRARLFAFWTTGASHSRDSFSITRADDSSRRRCLR